MAGNFNNLGKDSLDITELASLNDEISDEMVAQLEQQLTEKFGLRKIIDEPVNENDDSTLFEETQPAQAEENEEKEPADAAASTGVAPTITDKVEEPAVPPVEDTTEEVPQKAEVKQDFDDNFIKKYKAKLKNRAQGGDKDAPSYGGVAPEDDNAPQQSGMEEGPIETLSQGNITERALTGDQKKYKDSLDYLDKNVKYSKYVIYIDPQNVNFIESLTVKERKNLINGILREQDDISMTKLRFRVIQSIIRHVIIAVLTVAISIPVIYHVINASLEATINNHRNAQTNWQTLYKEHGKITHN